MSTKVDISKTFPEGNIWQKLEELQRQLIFLHKTKTKYEVEESDSNELLEGSSCSQVQESSDGTVRKDNNADLIKKIEDIFENCVQKSSNNEIPTIVLPNRKLWENVNFVDGQGIQMNANPIMTTIKRSRNTKKSTMKRFGQTLNLLSKIHSLLKSNTFCTKRELYYQDVKFYGTQTVVDSILDDIACLLSVPKIQLHVVSTSKGCVAGALEFKDADGNYIDCSRTSQGLLIPADVGGITNIRSNARFILVVEKDAIFQMLLEKNLLRKLHPCVLITGKGFPDVCTRQLLKTLWDSLNIPILALVDADSYGIEILCVYTYGSLSLSFDMKNLAVPHIRWLGILPSDLKILQFPPNALLDLAESDIKKAEHLLSRPYMQYREEWCQQVKFLLSHKKKAEIEGLSKISNDFLTDVYLPNKIKYGGWI